MPHPAQREHVATGPLPTPQRTCKRLDSPRGRTPRIRLPRGFARPAAFAAVSMAVTRWAKPCALAVLLRAWAHAVSHHPRSSPATVMCSTGAFRRVRSTGGETYMGWCQRAVYI